MKTKKWHYQEESDAYTHIVRDENNRIVAQLPQGKRCAIGGIAEVLVADPNYAKGGALSYLAKAVGYDAVSQWNDSAPDFSVIEQGFKKAIALAESEGC